MAGFLLPGINLMRPKNSISSSSLASSDSIVSEFVSIVRYRRKFECVGVAVFLKVAKCAR
jgi:hypothetical protein